MKYMNRDDITDQREKTMKRLSRSTKSCRKKRRHADTTDLMVEINAIISEYVEMEDGPKASGETRRFDISAIDFELLRREFAKMKNKNLAMKDLEAIIQQKLDRLLFNNPDRIDYYERYQQIITDYNSELDRATIEKTFMDLMDLANSSIKRNSGMSVRALRMTRSFLCTICFSGTISPKRISRKSRKWPQVF